MGSLIKRRRKQIKVIYIIKAFSFSFGYLVNYLVIDNKYDQTRIGFQVSGGSLRKRMTNKFLLSIQLLAVDHLDYTCPIIDAVPYSIYSSSYLYCSYEIK